MSLSHMHSNINLSIILLISVSSVACDEHIYYFDEQYMPHPVTEDKSICNYNITDVVPFKLSPSCNENLTVGNFIDEVNNRIDRANPYVHTCAQNMMSPGSFGEYNIMQVCDIYDNLTNKWIPTPESSCEIIQYPNQTLNNGQNRNPKIWGSGDCDDFAILLASLICNIGGTPRIVLAYDPNGGGHAYTEVYIGNYIFDKQYQLNKTLKQIFYNYKIHEIYCHINDTNGFVWLNLGSIRTEGQTGLLPGNPYNEIFKNYILIEIKDIDNVPATSSIARPTVELRRDPVPVVGINVYFTAAAKSYDEEAIITRYNLKLDDGTEIKPVDTRRPNKYVYNFSKSGNVTLKLEVTDNKGASTSKEFEFMVEDPLIWGNKQRDNGNYDGALKAYDIAIRLNYNKSYYKWVLNNKSVAYSNLRLDKEARKVLISAIEQNPGNSSNCSNLEILYNYGNNSYNMKDYDEAIQAFDEIIKCNQTNHWTYPLVYKNIGRSLYKTGRYTEAIKALKMSTQIAPNNSWTWYDLGEVVLDLGNYSDSIQAFNKSIEISQTRGTDRNDQAQAFDGIGRVYSKRGDYVTAILKFDEATTLKDNYVEAWYDKCDAYRAQKWYPAAINASGKVLELDPENEWALKNKGYSLGHLDRSQENLEKAIEALDKAIKLNSTFDWAYIDKAIVLARYANITEADKVFDEVIKKCPNNDRAWYQRGVMYGKTNNYTQSLYAFDNTIAKNPKNDDAWYAKGYIFYIQNDSQRAVQSFNNATKINPCREWFWYNKTKFFSEDSPSSTTTEAIKTFDKATKDNDRDVWSWYNKGRFLIMRGKGTDYQDAETAFRKFTEINSNLPLTEINYSLYFCYGLAWYNRGLVLDKLNRHPDADKAFDKAIVVFNEIIKWKPDQPHGDILDSRDKATSEKDRFHP